MELKGISYIIVVMFLGGVVGIVDSVMNDFDSQLLKRNLSQMVLTGIYYLIVLPNMAILFSGFLVYSIYIFCASIVLFLASRWTVDHLDLAEKRFDKNNPYFQYAVGFVSLCICYCVGIFTLLFIIQW